MNPSTLNLARRPFVDARPANVVAAVLGLAVVILTFVSWTTVDRYLAGSQRSRETVVDLKTEIAELEKARREGEEALSGFDLEAMASDAEKANLLARRRAFSWTRFLSRLEGVLPNDVRVLTISVQKASDETRLSDEQLAAGLIPVELTLVSRDPDGFPRVIEAFYGSPYFDRPVPQNERGGEQGRGEGRELALSVGYRDAGGAR